MLNIATVKRTIFEGSAVRKCKGKKLEIKVVESPSAELISGSLRSLSLGGDDPVPRWVRGKQGGRKTVDYFQIIA